MKFRALLLVALTGLFTACGGGEKKTETNSNTPSASPATETVVEEPVVAEVDPMENIGIGPIDELEFDEEIDMEIADAGKVIYEAK